MKVIKYQIMQETNMGTEDVPDIRKELRPVTLGPMYDASLEANYAMAVAEAYNGEVTVEDVPMTAEEARAQRDKLLLETDWTQVLDAPISAESREAFRVYRQALRDITEQPGFPEVIEWPEKPEVVKAAPDPVDAALDVLIGEEEG